MVGKTSIFDLSRSSFFSPIYTYSGRGTTKHGVEASEHGIAYSWGNQATLLPGETGITKPSLQVVMTEGERDLDRASRIYYGIHHPIQYNVKVKDVGYVVPDQVPILIENWKKEDGETKQSGKVTASAEMPQKLLESASEDPWSLTARFEALRSKNRHEPGMLLLLSCYHNLELT
jgi:hypothetical protein